MASSATETTSIVVQSSRLLNLPSECRLAIWELCMVKGPCHGPCYGQSERHRRFFQRHAESGSRFGGGVEPVGYWPDSRRDLWFDPSFGHRVTLRGMGKWVKTYHWCSHTTHNLLLASRLCYREALSVFYAVNPVQLHCHLDYSSKHDISKFGRLLPTAFGHLRNLTLVVQRGPESRDSFIIAGMRVSSMTFNPRVFVTVLTKQLPKLSSLSLHAMSFLPDPHAQDVFRLAELYQGGLRPFRNLREVNLSLVLGCHIAKHHPKLKSVLCTSTYAKTAVAETALDFESACFRVTLSAEHQGKDTEVSSVYENHLDWP